MAVAPGSMVAGTYRVEKMLCEGGMGAHAERGPALTVVATPTASRRSIAAFVLAVAALTWTTPARATDPATAQTLFDQARKLMGDERWSDACPKLEESQRLDPAGGTLLHLALCREREGRIATAWALYQDALSQAKRDGRRDRAKIAKERVDVLGPRLPHLRIRVAGENKNTRGFTLDRDGDGVGKAQWDEAFPVDPGILTLRAQAPGKRPFTTRVDVPTRPGELVVDIPPLEDDPTAKTGPPDMAPESPATAPPSGDSTRGNGQRTLALVTAGVGVVGVGVGSVFGLMSMSNKSSAESACRPPDYKLCSAEGVDAGNAAIRNGNVSTVAFIVGGLLVAGGAALYFTAPTGTVAVAPSVGPRAASLGLSGSFW